MQRNNFLIQFAAMPAAQQSRMLLLLSLELTLVARDVYGSSEYRQPAKLASTRDTLNSLDHADSAKLTIARGISEMHHQISGHLLKMDQPEKRYPDNVFVDVLCDLAEGHRMQVMFPAIWLRAFSRLSSV